ncbi:MAG TPA: transcriptional regulator GcvA [Pelomicrobium sp.]|nr:transcriptional regulator GcvA [Pelomicrobium sp.]
MAYRLPPLNAFRAFEAAARHLSFKKAAEELHVTPAAISHMVKALEEQLEVKLFRRLTRALELTDAGKAALPKVQEAFDSLAVAVERTRSHARAGPLAVSAPPLFAARWLVPRLYRFTERHPEIKLRISSAVGAIDDGGAGGQPPEAESGESNEDTLVTVRFGRGRYPGARIDWLFDAAYAPVCSPRLLRGSKPLATPEDLRHHTLLHDDTVRDVAERLSWEAWLKAAGVSGVDPARGPRFTNSALAIDAAVDGLGVALGVKPLVADDIAAGDLVAPFDVEVESGFAYYFVCDEAVAERPQVVAFRDWLLREAAAAQPLASTA